MAILVSGVVALTEAAQPIAGTVQDQTGTPLGNAVVWAQPLGHPPESARPPKPAVVEQRQRAFSPAVVAIRAGTQVDFPNNDTVFHNIYSFSRGNRFNLGLYKPGQSRSVVLTTPGVVKVFCNIHDVMRATIVVLETPYFAITDVQGAYLLPPLPPGLYEVQVWHNHRYASPREIDTRVGDSSPLNWVLPTGQ